MGKFHLLLISLFLGFTNFNFAHSADWKIGEIYSGFELKKITAVQEILGNVFFFEHKKTGTPLIYFSNGDENKTFGIAFKTLPNNSTGVFHVFEHAVLAGSRKYPAKSLLFEVAGSSVNTFLNALTFPDHTFYPVASTNNKDFNNLVNIYLDAVFFPQVMQNENIFRREGWRYELDAKEQLTYNGIVYSEMKGLSSNPYRILSKKIAETIVPSSPYAFDSGGDPLVLPQLTFNELISVHKKFYHPSNSIIMFYGNGNISEHLQIVNQDYLSLFSSRKEKIEVPIPDFRVGAKPELIQTTFTYEISSKEKKTGKSFHARSLSTTLRPSYEEYLIENIFLIALTEFQASPLRQTLINHKLCSDLQSGLDLTAYYETTFICSGSDPENGQKFNSHVDKMLAQVKKNGLKKQLIQAAFNALEFNIREYKTIDRGLTIQKKVLKSWVYGHDPLEFVQYEKAFEAIKVKLGDPTLSKSWAEKLLKSPRQTLVTLNAEPGLLEKNELILKKELAQKKSTLNLEKIKEEIQAFNQWNKSSTPKKDLEKIPLISVKDLNRKNKILKQNNFNLEDVTLIETPIDTQGIIYATLYFDLKPVPESLYPYLPLLTEALEKVDTRNHSYKDLELDLYSLVGGTNYSVQFYNKRTPSNQFESRFAVNFKVEASRLEDTLKLLQEILLSSKFTSKKRMEQIFQSYFSNLESSLSNNALNYARISSKSAFLKSARYENLVAGISQFSFLKEQQKLKKFDPINEKLASLSQLIFNKKNLVVGLACSETLCAEARDKLVKFFKQLPESTNVKDPLATGETSTLSATLKQGISFPSQVQYLSLFSFQPNRLDSFGQLMVATNILRFQYLYPRLREQGGAYTVGMIVNHGGEINLFTSRDPRAKESEMDLRNAGNFLVQNTIDQHQMDRAIIKTIGTIDMPITAAETLKRGLSWYFENINQEELQRIRDQVLTTNSKNLKKWGENLNTILQKESSFSGMGNENQMKALFDQKGIIPL